MEETEKRIKTTEKAFQQQIERSKVEKQGFFSPFLSIFSIFQLFFIVFQLFSLFFNCFSIVF